MMNIEQKTTGLLLLGMGIAIYYPSMAMAQSYHLVDGYKFEDSKDASSLEEPIFHLRLKHNPKEDWIAAGRDLRDGAAFMRLEAKHATIKGRRALHSAIERMEKLALSIENKEEVAVVEVENAYAKAMLALAQHHHLKASLAWNNKEWEKVEKELLSAAHYLRSASNWAKQDMKGSINATALEVEGFYEQVLLKEGTSLERMGARIEAFDKEMDISK